MLKLITISTETEAAEEMNWLNNACTHVGVEQNCTTDDSQRPQVSPQLCSRRLQGSGVGKMTPYDQTRAFGFTSERLQDDFPFMHVGE